MMFLSLQVNEKSKNSGVPFTIMLSDESNKKGQVLHRAFPHLCDLTPVSDNVSGLLSLSVLFLTMTFPMDCCLLMAKVICRSSPQSSLMSGSNELTNLRSCSSSLKYLTEKMSLLDVEASPSFF